MQSLKKELNGSGSINAQLAYCLSAHISFSVMRVLKGLHCHNNPLLGQNIVHITPCFEPIPTSHQTITPSVCRLTCLQLIIIDF